MDYILISYYNPGRDSGKWEVYGHRSQGDNDFLGSFEAEEEAREEAAKYRHYGIPMILGGHGATDMFFNRMGEFLKKQLHFMKKVERMKSEPPFNS